MASLPPFCHSPFPPGQQTIRQKTADAMDAARGPSFAADKDEGPQRGSGRPIPPLVSKIQVATTNAGARGQGGLTPDFLALSRTIAPPSGLSSVFVQYFGGVRMGRARSYSAW